MAAFVFFAALYLAVAAACLGQWGAGDPWTRFDVFSIGFFLAAPVWIAEVFYFHRAIDKGPAVFDEASGRSYDPGMLRGISALPVVEPAVFLDYGRWHLLPSLETPLLQGVGLGLCFLAPALLLWADRHLADHFGRAEASRSIITEGPYRWVRHPRYAGLLLNRAGFALVFASVIGWALFAGWYLLVRRRIRLEEEHLQKRYGPTWEQYAAGRARLVPGVY
jgi:protein-S-isoprenylcysteine O-methyltransferase Ste14